MFRKLKFGEYINFKRNKQKMIRNFRKMYGNPEDVMICIGTAKTNEIQKPTLGKFNYKKNMIYQQYFYLCFFNTVKYFVYLAGFSNRGTSHSSTVSTVFYTHSTILNDNPYHIVKGTKLKFQPLVRMGFSRTGS